MRPHLSSVVEQVPPVRAGCTWWLWWFAATLLGLLPADRVDAALRHNVGVIVSLFVHIRNGYITILLPVTPIFFTFNLSALLVYAAGLGPTQPPGWPFRLIASAWIRAEMCRDLYASPHTEIIRAACAIYCLCGRRWRRFVSTTLVFAHNQAAGAASAIREAARTGVLGDARIAPGVVPSQAGQRVRRHVAQWVRAKLSLRR